MMQLMCSDARDVVAVIFGEPEIAIRAEGDIIGSTTTGEAARELGDDSLRGNAPDPVARKLCKPEIAIWTSSNASRPALKRESSRKFGDDSCRGDASDQVLI